jgi:hypothetical protein
MSVMNLLRVTLAPLSFIINNPRFVVIYGFTPAFGIHARTFPSGTPAKPDTGLE